MDDFALQVVEIRLRDARPLHGECLGRRRHIDGIKPDVLLNPGSVGGHRNSLLY